MTAVRKPRTSQQGFALPDVLIGTVILVVAVFSLASAALSTSKLRRTVEEKDLAIQALDEICNRIESTSYDDIVLSYNGMGFMVDPWGIEFLNVVPGDADNRPGSVIVTAPAPFNDPDELLQVEVRVDWQGTAGPQFVRRVLLISKPGAVK
jgi:hypothetical protein